MSAHTSAVTRRAHPGENPGDADEDTPTGNWMFAGLPRRRDDIVLDIAAGTGLGGLSLAPDVRQVIVLDRSEANWGAGAREARAAGLDNLEFVTGDPAELPFGENAFRLVLCGCALHHFTDPAIELAEIRRVLRPWGWLGLADLVVSESAEVAAAQNRLEALRDPSHTRALSASELQDRLVRSGFEVAGAETREFRQPLSRWLEATETPLGAAQQITAALDDELNGGPRTGLSPERAGDGTLSLAHVLTSLLVLNPDGETRAAGAQGDHREGLGQGRHRRPPGV